jgi:hypothetical protein
VVRFCGSRFLAPVNNLPLDRWPFRCYIIPMINLDLRDLSNWTIRTRHTTTGHYHEASYWGMTLYAAKAAALTDHPNSEVVGVWPHAW